MDYSCSNLGECEDDGTLKSSKKIEGREERVPMEGLPRAIRRPREGACSAQDDTASRVGLLAPWGQYGVVVSVPHLSNLVRAARHPCAGTLCGGVQGGGRRKQVGWLRLRACQRQGHPTPTPFASPSSTPEISPHSPLPLGRTSEGHGKALCSQWLELGEQRPWGDRVQR